MVSHTNLHLPGTAQSKVGDDQLLQYDVSVYSWYRISFMFHSIFVEPGSENVYPLPSLVLLVLAADLFFSMILFYCICNELRRL
jgi:hypothetical protein